MIAHLGGDGKNSIAQLGRQLIRTRECVRHRHAADPDGVGDAETIGAGPVGRRGDLSQEADIGAGRVLEADRQAEEPVAGIGVVIGQGFAGQAEGGGHHLLGIEQHHEAALVTERKGIVGNT